MAQLLLELGRLGEAKPPNEERDACGIWVPFFLLQEWWRFLPKHEPIW